MIVKLNMANFPLYFEQGVEKDLAVFLFLKKECNNPTSTLFDYSPDKIASILNCCHNTAHNYIKRFLDRGWVRKHSNNLTFTSPRKFKDNIPNSLLKPFEVKGDVKQIQDDLYLFFLKHKQNQFNRVKNLAHEIKAPVSSGERRKALRMTKKNNYSVDKLSDRNAKFKVSIKKIADWFNCSIGKASQIINKFKRLGLIKVEKSYQVLARITDRKMIAAFLFANPGSYFNGKCIIKVACNEYQF